MKNRTGAISLLVIVALGLLLVLVFQQLILIQSRLEALELLVTRLNTQGQPVQSPGEPAASPSQVSLGTTFVVHAADGSELGRITPGDVRHEPGLIGVFVRYDGVGQGFYADPGDWTLRAGEGAMYTSTCPDDAPASCLVGRPLNPTRSTEGWLWFPIQEPVAQPLEALFAGDRGVVRVSLGAVPRGSGAVPESTPGS